MCPPLPSEFIVPSCLPAEFIRHRVSLVAPNARCQTLCVQVWFCGWSTTEAFANVKKRHLIGDEVIYWHRGALLKQAQYADNFMCKIMTSAVAFWRVYMAILCGIDLYRALTVAGSALSASCASWVTPQRASVFGTGKCLAATRLFIMPHEFCIGFGSVPLGGHGSLGTPQEFRVASVRRAVFTGLWSGCRQ